MACKFRIDPVPDGFEVVNITWGTRSWYPEKWMAQRYVDGMKVTQSKSPGKRYAAFLKKWDAKNPVVPPRKKPQAKRRQREYGYLEAA